MLFFLLLVLARIAVVRPKKSCNLHEVSSHACSLMLFVSPCHSPSNRGKTKFYCNTQIYPNILFVIFVGSMKAINVYQIPHISIDFLQKYTQHMPKTLTELREMGQLRHQGQALMPIASCETAFGTATAYADRSANT